MSLCYCGGDDGVFGHLMFCGPMAEVIVCSILSLESLVSYPGLYSDAVRGIKCHHRKNRVDIVGAMPSKHVQTFKII